MIENNNKNTLIKIIKIISTISLVLVVSLIILKFLIHSGWSREAALDICIGIVGTISTIFLGCVANRQNEKLRELENNNFIANNSCMVSIELFQFIATKHVTTSLNDKKIAPQVLCNDSEHTEQILSEVENTDKNGLIVSAVIELSKVPEHSLSTPAYVNVTTIDIIIVDKNNNEINNAFKFDNIREGFSRFAITRDKLKFGISFLFKKEDFEKIQEIITDTNNKLAIDMILEIITDKKVATKCKCSAELAYPENGKDYEWGKYNSNDNSRTYLIKNDIKHSFKVFEPKIKYAYDKKDSKQE